MLHICRKIRKNRIVLGIIFLTFLIASCTTAPPPVPKESWFAILPKKSDVYIFLRKEKTEDIIERLIKNTEFDNKDVRFILSKTSLIFAGIMTDGDSNNSKVSLLALGNYPKGMIEFQLWMNSAWKSKKGSSKYWVNRKDNIELTIPKNQLLMISQGYINEMVSNYITPRRFVLPEKLNIQLNNVDFVVFIPGLSDSNLSPELKKSKIPVNALWIAMERLDTDFMVGADFILPTEKQAKLFSFVFRLILAAWLREEHVEGIGEKLKGIKIMSSGKDVSITGLSLSPETILGIASKLFSGGNK